MTDSTTFSPAGRSDDVRTGGDATATTPTTAGTDHDGYTKTLKKEAGKWRKRLRETEAQMQAANERLLHARLETAALKAGMTDLDVLRFNDRASVRLNDDGSLEGADALFDRLRQSHPTLFGAPASAPAGRAGAGASTSSTNVAPKAGAAQPFDAMKATDAQRAAHWAEIVGKR